MILGSVLVDSFTAYYVLRPLTSVFLTAGQTIGLTFVKDMYFFHEHARKIGIWVCIFLASPYFGPFLCALFFCSLTFCPADTPSPSQWWFHR